jgi:biopolymer transport protein ExbB/TolQ
VCLLLSATSLFAQDDERQFFRLDETQGEPLDLRQLQQQFNDGAATIKLELDGQGGVRAAQIYQLSPNKEALAEALANTMRTWRYKEGASGVMYVSVSIPNASQAASEGRAPAIALDLRGLKIDNKNITINMESAHHKDLVAQRGFDGKNITITAIPAELEPKFDKPFWEYAVVVLKQLGTFFQWLFAITFVALLGAWWINIKRVFMPTWEPINKTGWPIIRDISAYLSQAKAQKFDSDQSKEVAKIWENVITNTHSDSDLWSKYELDVHASEIRKRIADASFEEVAKVLKEYTWKVKDKQYSLLELVGGDFLYRFNHENGSKSQDTNELKKQVLAKLREKKQDASSAEFKKLEKTIKSVEAALAEEDIRETLIKYDYGEFLETERALEPRPVTEIRNDIERILDDLQEIHDELNSNGNSLPKAREKERSSGQCGYMSKEQYEERKEFLWKHFGEPRIEEARRICQRFRNFPLFQIFESGLENHKVNRNNWWASQEIDRSVDRTATIKVDERRGRLDWIWAIGSLSPLFGLFGTVWGISQAFAKIKDITDQQELMRRLAGDINVALSTTIVGLVIAVLALISYYVFKSVVDNQAALIEKYFTDITNKA